MQPGWLRRINWWRPSPRLASIYRAERSLGSGVQPVRSDIDVWGEEIDATLGSHRSRPVNTSRPINLWIEPKINVWIFAQCQPRIDFKSNWCSMVQFWFWVTSSFQRALNWYEWGVGAVCLFSAFLKTAAEWQCKISSVCVKRAHFMQVWMVSYRILIFFCVLWHHTKCHVYSCTAYLIFMIICKYAKWKL